MVDGSFVTGLAAASDEEVIARRLRLGQCQGYFFSRPCAAEQFGAWLSDSPYRPPAATRPVPAG